MLNGAAFGGGRCCWGPSGYGGGCFGNWCAPGSKFCIAPALATAFAAAATAGKAILFHANMDSDVACWLEDVVLAKVSTRSRKLSVRSGSRASHTASVIGRCLFMIMVRALCDVLSELELSNAFTLPDRTLPRKSRLTTYACNQRQQPSKSRLTTHACNQRHLPCWT